MNSLVNVRSILVAACLFAATAACDRSETAERAEEAAEEVRDQTEDLRESAREVVDTADEQREDLADRARVVDPRPGIGDDIAGAPGGLSTEPIDPLRAQRADRAADSADDLEELADDQRDVGANARELASASTEFEARKLARIQTLRAVHGVAASQPMLINALIASTPLTENGRVQTTKQLQALQMRIDEAGNAIASLDGVEAAAWEERDEQVSEAMERLEDAREDAWDQLADADRIDQTSMR